MRGRWLIGMVLVGAMAVSASAADDAQAGMLVGMTASEGSLKAGPANEEAQVDSASGEIPDDLLSLESREPTLKLDGETLAGVTLGTAPCHSEGQHPETVVTAPITLELGWIDRPKLQVGIEYRPSHGTLIAQFTCGAAEVEVRGGAIGRVAIVNKKLSRIPVEFSDREGSQSVAAFEGGTTVGLEAQIDGGGWRPASLSQLGDLVTTGGTLEALANSVELEFVARPATAKGLGASQCSGSDIAGQGASELQSMEGMLGSAFDTSANPFACDGKQASGAKPGVSYSPSAGSTDLWSWGVDGGHGDFGPANAFIGTDDPPNATEKAEVEAHEMSPGSVPETLQTMPVAQEALAVIAHLPDECLASSKSAPGRLALDNEQLQRIFVGEILNWDEISGGGDSLTGPGCDSPISRVARPDVAGTTHILKRYLGLIEPGAFETENGESATWDELAEDGQSTVWPAAAKVLRPEQAGDAAEISLVAATPGSIGYSTLADARANASFVPPDGGAGRATFWTQIQNNGTSTKPKYADPSTDDEQAEPAGANCAKTTYTDGTKPLPASTAETWNEVASSTAEKGYPLCGLSYELVMSSYGAYPGTTQHETAAVKSYLLFQMAKEAEGGQSELAKDDRAHSPSSFWTKLWDAIVGLSEQCVNEFGEQVECEEGTSVGPDGESGAVIAMAFQANTSNLFVWGAGTEGDATNKDTGLGMARETSPSIAASPDGGYEVAFQANTGDLWSYTTQHGGVNHALGMWPGTSPSIAGLSGGGYEIAFQTNTGELWAVGAAGNVHTGLGMMKGTSPSIAASPNGGYEVAFQANTGVLWTYSSSSGGTDTGYQMMVGTSPSIAPLYQPEESSGYEVAFENPADELFFLSRGSANTINTHLGMWSPSSPSVAGVKNGSYEGAFQANTGSLWKGNAFGSGDDLMQGMLACTSPSIAGLFRANNPGYQVAFQANTGALIDVGPYTYTNTTQGMMPCTDPSIAGLQ